MLDNEPTTGSDAATTAPGPEAAPAAPRRRRAASRAAGAPATAPTSVVDPGSDPAATPSSAPTADAAVIDTAVIDTAVTDTPAPRRRTRKAAAPAAPEVTAAADAPVPAAETAAEAPAAAPAKRTRARKTAVPAPAPETTASADAAAAQAQAQAEADAVVPAADGSPAAEPTAPRKRASRARGRAATPGTEPAVEPAPSVLAEVGTADPVTAQTLAAVQALPSDASTGQDATPEDDEELATGAGAPVSQPEAEPEEPAAPAPSRRRRAAAPVVLFQAPAVEAGAVSSEPSAQERPEKAPDAEQVDTPAEAPTGRRRGRSRAAAPVVFAPPEPEGSSLDDELVGLDQAAEPAEESSPDGEEGGDRRRRRGGRGRRGRGRSARDAAAEGEDGAQPEDVEPAAAAGRADDEQPEGSEDASTETEDADADGDGDGDQSAEGPSTRRRRRRRRGSGSGDPELSPDDPPNTVVRVRESRARRGGEERESRGTGSDEVTSIKGSTRLEAKKQRRREGRDQGRRRPPIITEAEFLARREAVERTMVVRQVGDRTQIAVLEDDVLVEHYVNRESSTSFVGNIYLARVQNVLPSMEAAFLDISKGRNGVLYAGEVNWDAAGMEGQPKRIEMALKSGQSVLVQVTKDPIGQKGSRLTSQISLPGRYLVYVPEGSMTGISRKLPDTERTRLKGILKRIVPQDAGVIVRTAAEGASEEELARDVARLSAQWEDIQRKARTATAPALLSGEPDLAVRVIRDIFNEDFTRLVVSGADAYDEVRGYLDHVAPELAERVTRWTSERDVFTEHRIDEQLAKALDRKVWLPSGGSLVIDRTEAMVVVDVNTGKFIGKGGNLEETVTKNNLEAAEEIVRQLRLRDLGGIVVIDFIDMVLESNRELVMRRLLECLGRDRTKHQVAEVTSLGLVQMTRKRVGQGLLEAFSEPCEHCRGRGVLVHMEPVGPVGPAKPQAPVPATGRRERGRRAATPAEVAAVASVPTPAELAAVVGADLHVHRPADADAHVVDPGPDVPATPEMVARSAVAHEDPVAEHLPAPTQAPTVTVVAEELVEAAVVADQLDSGRPRRRGRRAASRPAGPPSPATG